MTRAVKCLAEIQKVPIPQGFLEIKKSWCKGCSLCADLCPRGLIIIDQIDKVQIKDSKECLGCGLCEAICPDFAIRVKKDEKAN